MQIIQNTTDFHIPEETAVAIGKFDGIHKGHRLLLAQILKEKKNGKKAAVFTFDPAPTVFFGNTDIEEITTIEEKRECFSQMGIDYVVEYPFNEKTASVDPETYVEDFLLDKMHAKFIAAGKDVSFGKYGAGDKSLLQKIAGKHECEVHILDKLQYNGTDISSTLVREVIKRGNMEEALKLLGSPFFVSGTVVHGNALGRTIGFPTINVLPQNNKLLPPNGVYFCDVLVQDKRYHGITNIGNKPTIGEGYQKGVETFLYDFDKDIYGEYVRIELLHFVRKECRFSNFDELKKTISNNVLQGRLYFRIES